MQYVLVCMYTIWFEFSMFDIVVRDFPRPLCFKIIF